MLRSALLALCAGLLPLSAQAEDVYDAAESAVHSFEKIFGVTEGKRRNHTKGFCFDAEFIPADPAIRDYTASPIFRQTSPVIGRLSHKGGDNLAADHKPADYGLAIRIDAPDDVVHIINMNTLDFFPVSTPRAFAELMRAKAGGKAAVKAFAKKSRELQAYKKHHARKDRTLRPYEGATYNSVNSFYLVGAGGKRTAIRWSFIPAREQKVVLKPEQDFFFENMKANLAAGDIVWDMVVTLANPGDKVDNANIPWTGEHKTITAAKLKVKAVSTERDGRCDTINYDPLVLSDGFEPSGDPLLAARSISYAISADKRLREKARMN